jgi:nucleoside phosphorylase
LEKGNAGVLFYTYVELDNGTRVDFVSLTDPGTAQIGGANNTTNLVINVLNPDAIIMGGICFGIREDESQEFGDMIVSKAIWDYEYRAEKPDGTDYRGLTLPTSPNLQRLFIREDLTSDYPFSTNYGLIACGNAVVKSTAFREKLLKEKEKMIGGDMESFGVASACFAAERGTGCIVVKAICDFGDEDKSDDFQSLAAHNSFEFILSCLESIAR